MKTSLVIIIAVVIIVVVAALALVGLGTPATQTPTHPSPTTSPSPTQTTTQTQQPQTTEQPPSAPLYNAELANKGLSFFKEVGCVACHSIKSLGVSGGNVGPDLSKALLDSQSQWLGRYYKENGLQNPASDPAKAAELLAKFLTQPPQYATTMTAQIAAYKSLYGDQWEKEYVPALVELMKMAASK
ncbi:c-type cytochrome [Pyrobaculum calidifontis]|uniref:Cytochrome c domain-containing protein n=1 Tax=Pyrobaculum calidifontis (strain DSM 21063 / JCM 11548 / VA1) TaxID=410359 RepID=A3MXJ6_PYRCJ|nr:c-type cytochrome [Pyrobaculum calidifontis]ABO09363.1 hypothetical protein Pcal_1947 [Pyrobaculum calidifontis JCM 11548]